MADRLVIDAKVAAADSEFEVPYSLEVELNNGSKTTYFEECFNKKLLETKDSFAKQKGNESLQKCLTEINSELFNKVYKTLLSIAAYTSMISLHGSIIKEFFENYESTEVANDLMKKCKEKLHLRLFYLCTGMSVVLRRLHTVCMC
uniref:MIF4G domain-containing protein n=1 Tax=Globodera pallida TaxID=36090 RepID=A0A183C058_GLOPA